MVMTRHEFLEALHKRFMPKIYLEVGVQYGPSLALANYSNLAIGIDPNPMVLPENQRLNQLIHRTTSDQYFDEYRSTKPPSGSTYVDLYVDLAFIDGMHLLEYAFRDFHNIEQHCHPGSIVVFDDVLPRNEHEARRMAPGDPVLGDWTGDVWKIYDLLKQFHPGAATGLKYRLVDTDPTGCLVVTGFPRRRVPWELSGDALEQAAQPRPVPTDTLNRRWAWRDPNQLIDTIAKELEQCRSQ